MSRKNHSRKLKILFFFTLLLVLGVGRVVLAQSNNLDEPFGAKTDMASLTRVIFEFGIALCVLAAAIYIAWGSLQYFLAAGNAKYAEEGKNIIIRAIQGLVLALVSWIILNTIHSQFTELKVQPFKGVQIIDQNVYKIAQTK